METVARIHTGERPGTVVSNRSTVKRAYDLAVLAFLVANVIRLSVAVSVTDAKTALNLGDFSHHWSRRRHMLDIPLIYWGAYAAVVNALFLFGQRDQTRKWIVPFSIFRWV